MMAPAAEKFAVVLLLTSVSPVDGADGTVTLTAGEVVVPDFPAATLVTPPLSTSACVVM